MTELDDELKRARTIAREWFDRNAPLPIDERLLDQLRTELGPRFTVTYDKANRHLHVTREGEITQIKFANPAVRTDCEYELQVSLGAGVWRTVALCVNAKEAHESYWWHRDNVLPAFKDQQVRIIGILDQPA